MNEQTETPETAQDSEIAARFEPILEHLNVEGTDIDKDLFRKRFIELWKYENGDTLPPEEQFLTTVGIFMYASHNILDDYNIRVDRARENITAALDAWQKPERDKLVEAERGADNPFKAFVDNQQPLVDETHTWQHFLLEHKKADEKRWTYKMKKCWFAEFFIRFGRTDYIETACMFDQLPWKAREEYVDLKLTNLFRKLGQMCQFEYKAKKPESEKS